MGSLLTTPLTASFNGTSQYAQDLQQVINRAVALAAIPMQQLIAEQNALSAKASAAQSLQNAISAVNTAVQQLSPATANTLSTSVSDSSVVDATAASGALPGTYTIQVTNAGSYSTASSNNGLPTVTDPSSQSISSSSSFTLTVGSSTYTIQPSTNSLNALANAINASGAGVQATVVNIGAPSSPDYRLALQSTSLGPVSLQLNDGSSNLLSTLTTGANATYTVNGQPSGGISSNSSTVTIAPGLTANLKATGTATVQVSFNESNIASALNSFVTAFNSAHTELQKSFGQNAGALSGDSTVFNTSSALSQLANYTASSGNIQSLSDIGIEFTDQGTLTFDSSKLSAMSPSQLGDVLTFLGDPATGGFLQSATNTLNGLLDPTTGTLPNEINSLNQQVTNEAQQIQVQQDKLNQLQDNLAKQMAAADTLIATLQQQTSFLTALLSTTNANNFAGH